MRGQFVLQPRRWLRFPIVHVVAFPVLPRSLPVCSNAACSSGDVWQAGDDWAPALSMPSLGPSPRFHVPDVLVVVRCSRCLRARYPVPIALGGRTTACDVSLVLMSCSHVHPLLSTLASTRSCVLQLERGAHPREGSRGSSPRLGPWTPDVWAPRGARFRRAWRRPSASFDQKLVASGSAPR